MPTKDFRSFQQASRSEDGFIPSPEEIERECARIRDSWTDKERRKRAGIRYERWTVPERRLHPMH